MRVIILMSALVVGIMACQKEEVAPIDDQVNEGPVATLKTNGNGIVIPARHINIVREAVSGKVVDIWCEHNGGTCARTVTVTSKSIAPIIEDINTKNNALILSTFTTHQMTLVGIFGQDNVDRVIDGSLTVINLGTYAHNGVNETFIQFLNSAGESVSSHPLILH